MKFCGGQKDDEQDSDDECGIDGYMVTGGKNTKNLILYDCHLARKRMNTRRRGDTSCTVPKIDDT